MALWTMSLIIGKAKKIMCFQLLPVSKKTCKVLLDPRKRKIWS